MEVRIAFPVRAAWVIFLLASLGVGQEAAKPADSAPPTPVASRPTQAVRFVPVSRERVEARLKQFETTNAKRKASLERMFQEAGCVGGRLREGRVKQSKLPNVICTLPGETDTVILVGAHYDLAERGKGVVDNWTGAALLPSLLESLAGQSRHHTFVFVGFTDEEKGLVGSKFYVNQLTPQEKQSIRAMVNLDTLGLSPTKVWASRADPRLLTALAEVARSMKLPLQGVNVEKVGSSDSEPFAQQNIPAITIHSVTQETFPILHSPKDTPEAVRLDDYYQSYRMIAAYLSYLDTQWSPRHVSPSGPGALGVTKVTRGVMAKAEKPQCRQPPAPRWCLNHPGRHHEKGAQGHPDGCTFPYPLSGLGIRLRRARLSPPGAVGAGSCREDAGGAGCARLSRCSPQEEPERGSVAAGGGE